MAERAEEDESRMKRFSGIRRRFKEFIGVSPKRLARTYRFAASGGGSWANIPATCWTAGRCRPIDFLQQRQLTKR
jgi:hypothetical protein